ncbi:MAG: nucleotidyltransferase family protein [Anaerolineae bacterium]|nr:nucleotidyltransferase family protein [Anaerolineae bacterium]
MESPTIPAFDRYSREPIAPETLAVLRDFAAGDLSRPLGHPHADWQAVFAAVCNNGLLGVTYHYLIANGQAACPPVEFRESVTHTYRLTALRMALIYRAMSQVVQVLNEAGLDYLVVKGPMTAYGLYPDPSARIFNDLDVIVRERDWSRTHQLLTGMGFEQQDHLPDPPPKLIAEAVPYETQYWNTRLGIKVEVHYDDILNAGLASRDVDGFWQRAIPIEVQGQTIRTLSLEDQLIHLCAHMHYHGYVRMNWFTDVTMLLRQHGERLDWAQVVQTIRTEEAQVPVYYSLLFLEHLVGVHAPAEVMAAIQPGRFRRWLHDRYMPPEAILSFQPTARPDFSFYFRPLFKRMLPDLLVMGRRRDKLRYLGRLLLPPGDWLCYHYQLSDRRWLPVYYVLHPFRILYHYLRETVQVIATGGYVS